ncbi:CAF1 family ribonuclease (macronuclear) [Tetrahymena thermophila SB210]|uniref:CAF1 family ribonuclease n=1 Tax=Tetrahymena thermophila (strain SB210) TaxID=312017 RepID=Q24GK4_TETTS|nr:CAF1 family ribonuclease [Tetrahymena thermophila SB210]EAS06867.2 CAF1 family ribonuclease [Tetrahymena thermophila SB210]|eukprot:XP_001027109.2 CAF1 family ribonuclease [Tetrahymena thermophila SB210]
MEVTIKNYKEAHEKIENLLSKQEIISISFGALSSKQSENNGYKSFDYPFDLYFKNFRFSKYGLIQTGITILEKINQFQYKAHPFIFYLFPNDEQSQITLSSDLFDLDINWNKWMAEGIHFKNREQLDKFRQHIYNLPKADQKKENFQEMFSKLDDIRQEQVKVQLNKLKEFIDNDKSESEFNFDSAYSNIRRIYYTYLEEFHQDLIILKSGQGNISVKKCSVEEKQQYDIQLNQEREEKVEEQRGISKTFDLIFKHCQTNKIPLLVFNSLYELSQLISNTVCFLPRSFLEFKQLLTNTIPSIVDIKYTMFSLHNQRNMEPSAFINKNQLQFVKHQVDLAEGVVLNSLAQKTIDIAKIWLNDQQKIANHQNKLFFDKSNWIISLNPDHKDIVLIPENKALLTIVSTENQKTMNQKRYSIQKIFQELTKFHKKQGAYYQKSETQGMIIISVDITKINDLEGYKKNLTKIKDAKFDDYEAFYPILLNQFEDQNKQGEKQ